MPQNQTNAVRPASSNSGAVAFYLSHPDTVTKNLPLSYLQYDLPAGSRPATANPADNPGK